jgi:putative membrane protein
MNLLLRLAINAAALYTATRIVTGISYEGTAIGLAGVALVFAVVNGIIKPVVKFFSFPFIILTLGLFTLIVNGLMLMLTAHWSSALGFAFRVDGFGAAFRGALVVSLVSLVLNFLLVDEDKKGKE